MGGAYPLPEPPDGHRHGVWRRRRHHLANLGVLLPEGTVPLRCGDMPSARLLRTRGRIPRADIGLGAADRQRNGCPPRSKDGTGDARPGLARSRGNAPTWRERSLLAALSAGDRMSRRWMRRARWAGRRRASNDLGATIGGRSERGVTTRPRDEASVCRTRLLRPRAGNDRVAPLPTPTPGRETGRVGRLEQSGRLNFFLPFQPYDGNAFAW